MCSLIKFTSGKQQCSRPSVALRVWRLKVVMAGERGYAHEECGGFGLRFQHKSAKWLPGA